MSEACFGGMPGGGALFGRNFPGLIFSWGMSRNCPVGLSGVGFWISVQDYKSLGVAVMIWATMVNTQTDRETASDRFILNLSQLS